MLPYPRSGAGGGGGGGGGATGQASVARITDPSAQVCVAGGGGAGGGGSAAGGGGATARFGEKLPRTMKENLRSFMK
jgi:pre-mRNA-splicing factor ATP-dependent RNA helicase DHX38/PRP16